MKKTAVLICPGRGTYNKDELGYLARHHAGEREWIARFDALRKEKGQETLSALDGAERYSVSTHTRGGNASPLIYSASLFDARAVADDIEIVAATGNSMGWYTTLAAAGAVTPEAGFQIVNTMGTLMQEKLIGGQSLYPFVDDNWREVPGLKQKLLNLVETINLLKDNDLAVSIHLGGMLVVAGNEAGLAAFEKSVEPRDGRYPMRLHNHAAFHTVLQAPVSVEGQAALDGSLFGSPDIPMIDGRGAIWWPESSSAAALRDYTLGHQVVELYDFTRALTVAAREFAPDLFIITGPGTTLGGAVAQSLIAINWQGWTDKKAFQDSQKKAPILVSMGMENQRKLVLG